MCVCGDWQASEMITLSCVACCSTSALPSLYLAAQIWYSGIKLTRWQQVVNGTQITSVDKHLYTCALIFTPTDTESITLRRKTIILSFRLQSRSSSAETQTEQSRHGAVKVFSKAQRNPQHSFVLCGVWKLEPCNLKHKAMLTGFTCFLTFFLLVVRDFRFIFPLFNH